MDETSLPSLEIVVEHRVNAVCPYLRTGYSSSSLLSPLLAASEVAVPDITLNVVPGDGPSVESVIVETLGLRSRIRQRDADVKHLQRQVYEMASSTA